MTINDVLKPGAFVVDREGGYLCKIVAVTDVNVTVECQHCNKTRTVDHQTFLDEYRLQAKKERHA